MYRQLENGIEIQVTPEYDELQSSPSNSYYFYTYTVRLKNMGTDEVQLQSRYWLINDGQGRQETVEGEGVIGQKPFLKPGESFSYTSFCPLRTKTGNMRGHYSFYNTKKQQTFRSKIPLFFLRTPDTFSEV